MSKKALDYMQQETKDTRSKRPRGYVPFPPHVVADQIETLERMWGEAAEVIKAFPGGKSYARRLYHTRDKLIDEGHWE